MKVAVKFELSNVILFFENKKLRKSLSHLPFGAENSRERAHFYCAVRRLKFETPQRIKSNSSPCTGEGRRSPRTGTRRDGPRVKISETEQVECTANNNEQNEILLVFRVISDCSINSRTDGRTNWGTTSLATSREDFAR